ncbi:MAG: hypothetical protein HYZ27_03465, partial [Deltaproteobacteria bacterium]|nr:hypothetical protein [Deltaproteobacteria bacterium]
AVGALVGAGLLFLVWRRRGPWWLRFVLGFLAAGLLGGAYLGWVRRQAGLPSDAITSPKALIEDAQRAVERANERQRANEQGLFELEQQ